MKIAIIDDDKYLCANIKRKLEKSWYEVECFYFFQEFIKRGNQNFNLYIVDLGLQDGSGFEIIKHIRNKLRYATPILISSGYTDTEKKVKGLDLGADDYISKPIIPEEFLARVRALLRRDSDNKSDLWKLKYKNYFLHKNANKLKKGEESIHLRSKEADILELLIQNQWVAISRADFIMKIWWEDEAHFVTDNTINVTLSNLRKKLWDDIEITTVPSKGYILE